jgi:hypothetical protein
MCQVTKVIDRTHLRNTNFNKPDMKNNLTIPVTVKGQGPSKAKVTLYRGKVVSLLTERIIRH